MVFVIQRKRWILYVHAKKVMKKIMPKQVAKVLAVLSIINAIFAKFARIVK